MTVSQVLNHINENNYDDDITVTDIPPHNFIAVTGMTFDEGSGIRKITVNILPLEQETNPTQTTNSGLFIRKEGETAVTATVFQNGKELAINTQKYS